jgi:hypothetical protein
MSLSQLDPVGVVFGILAVLAYRRLRQRGADRTGGRR